jgi:hypothetical protein
MNRTRSMGIRSLMNSFEQLTGVEARPMKARPLDEAVKAEMHADVITPDSKAVKMADIKARTNIVNAYRHTNRPIIRNLY